MWSIVAALLLAGAPAEAPAAPGPAELPAVAGPWSPPDAGVSFPERAGEFFRTRIVRYGPQNWSVGYDRVRDGRKTAAATVFLYAPSDGSCPAQFDGAVQGVAAAYPRAVEVSRTSADSLDGGRPNAARRARHRMTAMFDRAERALLSDTYVYCRPSSWWTIKYRSTWPAAERGDDGGAPEVMRAIDWPAALAE